MVITRATILERHSMNHDPKSVFETEHVGRPRRPSTVPSGRARLEGIPFPQVKTWGYSPLSLRDGKQRGAENRSANEVWGQGSRHTPCAVGEQVL